MKIDCCFLVLTTTTTTLLSRGDDYEIDNPVYLVSGLAESALTTFATEFVEQQFTGLNVPGVSKSEGSTLLVKTIHYFTQL